MRFMRSRTQNVSINATVSLVCQILQIIIAFVSRTIFIKLLGSDYLGVNGLFTNVLTILSFAELGVGNAFAYSLYRPLAENDTKKVCQIMNLYKKTYRIMGGIIGGAGMLLIPFLPVIIKDSPNIVEDIRLLYVIYLFNTVSSYLFFSYKRSLVIADQKGYLIQISDEVILIIQTVLQLGFLYITRNYIVYLLIMLGATIANNLVGAIIANKKYPYLKKSLELPNHEISKTIFKNTKDFAIYRFGNVILNGTDNILISAMLGVTDVGIASNYVLLTTYANALLSKIAGAFTASLGNLGTATRDKDKLKNVFYKILFITAWIYGFASIGFVAVSSEFIRVWLGDDFVLGQITIIAIAADFYARGVQYATETYRTVLGYFHQGKYAAIGAAVLNIILSIALCSKIGLAGIYIATPISKLLTTGIVDPILIYKKSFEDNPMKYFLVYFGYIVLFSVIGVVSISFLSMVPIQGWSGVIIRVLLVSIIFNGIMLAIFSRFKMFKELKKAALTLLHRV